MRDARASETHDQRHGRLARLRQRYAASPELRELLAEHQRRTKRKPDIREKMKEYHKLARQKECLLGNNSREQLRHLDLMTRRAILLNAVIRRLQRSNQRWAWKSHTPVLDKDRVDRMKFLGNATDANSDQDRYMCNNCFASNWELMVPETYSGRLAPLFTSPDHPPPFKLERLNAEASANETKKEHEEDPQSMHEKDHKQGRT
jgi:hypothetical protein